MEYISKGLENLLELEEVLISFIFNNIGNNPMEMYYLC